MALRILGAPTGTSVQPWGVAGPAGYTNPRPATQLLMSAYDTNPTATDNTAAFQSALAAAAAIIASGVTQVDIVLDTRQKYQIGGAVTAGTQGQWCQVAVPWSTTSKGLIRLVGIPMSAADNFYSNTSGTVIESTLASAPAYSASVGIASTFGCGPASFCTTHVGGSTTPNSIMLATRDITIRSASPVICGIDAGFGNGFFFDSLLKFDTDAMASGGTLAVCTAPQAIPVIFPFFGDNRGTFGDDLVVSGWLGGPMLGEVAHIHRVTVFCTAGATLYLDASTQVSRIDYLIDWNNAYGIASTAPTSATPVTPATTGLGSGSNPGSLGFASVLHIGSWNVQTGPATGVPASTNRVADILDTANIVVMDALWASTNDAEVRNTAPVILGTGGTSTGLSTRKRILAVGGGQLVPNTGFPTVPASTTVIRNPFGRDCLVNIAGGTVTVVSVQSVTVGGASPSAVLVPANGIISLTYSAAPTWTWTVF